MRPSLNPEVARLITSEVIDGRRDRGEAGVVPGEAGTSAEEIIMDFDTVAAQYITAFNATDATERKAFIGEVFAADVSYVDPMAAVAGHDGVDAFIAGAHQQFPGWVFSLLGPVDGHGAQARFTWGLGPAGEEPPVVGFDVVVLDEEGRIAQVLGFLDKVPSA
ncbi:hypothetical protein GCM10010403_08290 [Glycomyces rutgersensis]